MTELRVKLQSGAELVASWEPNQLRLIRRERPELVLSVDESWLTPPGPARFWVPGTIIDPPVSDTDVYNLFIDHVLEFVTPANRQAVPRIVWLRCEPRAVISYTCLGCGAETAVHSEEWLCPKCQLPTADPIAALGMSPIPAPVLDQP